MTSNDFSATELATVTPENAATYLRATGWQLSGAFGRATSWRRNVGGDEVELILPNSRELRDYPVRIAELISSVAIIEDRQRKDVLHSLMFPLLDVQYVRTNPDAPSGTTPLHEGYLAVRGIHEVFLSAATAALQPGPSPVLPRNKPREALNFLNQAKLGPTSDGSYVIRVEIPVVAASATTPDTRNVLLYLYNAVQSARAAAMESLDGTGRRAFEAYVEHGVSASLCDALSDIGGPGKNSFSFSFAWAPQRPANLTPDIEFESRVIARLKEGSQHLKAIGRGLAVGRAAQELVHEASVQPASITGHVVELRRQRRDDVGSVVIDGSLVVDQRRQERTRVTVRLTANQYELAVHAHQTKQEVQAIGNLHHAGRGSELIGVGVFELTDDTGMGVQPQR